MMTASSQFNTCLVMPMIHILVKTINIAESMLGQNKTPQRSLGPWHG